MKLKVCYTDVSVDHVVYCDAITFSNGKELHVAHLITSTGVIDIDIHSIKYIFVE